MLDDEVRREHADGNGGSLRRRVFLGADFERLFALQQPVSCRGSNCLGSRVRVHTDAVVASRDRLPGSS